MALRPYVVLSSLSILSCGAVSWDDAQSLLRGKKIAILGDSVSRYCYFSLNYWLELEALAPTEYTSPSGNYSEDYDRDEEVQVWTSRGLISNRANHRQWFRKQFDTYSTEFFFIQDIWYDDMQFIVDIIADYDILIFNAGWWLLQDRADPPSCGNNFTAECAQSVDLGLGQVQQNLFDVIEQNGGRIFWRSSTCCGDSEAWTESIELINAAVERFFLNSSAVSYIDAYALYTSEDLDTVTFDGSHPTRDTCFDLNSLILDTICESSDTVSSCSNTVEIDDNDDTCMDSPSWFKKGDTSKNCDWVSIDKSRCGVKGENGQRAYEECHQACDTCPYSCENSPDSSTWHKTDETSKNCDWVATHFQPRCTCLDDQGVYAFQVCPHACRVCTYCENDATWSINNQSSKDCEWIATASQTRCSKRGTLADGTWTYAFQSCPGSCHLCPNFGECSDDSTWIKNNEEDGSDKNCDWIANGAPEKCLVKGTSANATVSTRAYQSCRIACSTC